MPLEKCHKYEVGLKCLNQSSKASNLICLRHWATYSNIVQCVNHCLYTTSNKMIELDRFCSSWSLSKEPYQFCSKYLSLLHIALKLLVLSYLKGQVLQMSGRAVLCSEWNFFSIYLLKRHILSVGMYQLVSRGKSQWIASGCLHLLRLINFAWFKNTTFVQK